MSSGSKKTNLNREIRATPLDGDGELWVLSMPVLGAAGEDSMEVLSAAESEVARLAARGLSNREIAKFRTTSERTVANQLRSVYVKLGVHSRGELAARMSSMGK